MLIIHGPHNNITINSPALNNMKKILPKNVLIYSLLTYETYDWKKTRKFLFI